MTMHATTAPNRRADPPSPLERRALALWPRLGHRALRRCRDDPRRIAELVSRRTTLDADVILRVLLAPAVSQEEAITWFG